MVILRCLGLLRLPDVRRTLGISCEAAIWTGLVSCIPLFDGLVAPPGAVGHPRQPQPSRVSGWMVTPTRNAAYRKGTPVVTGRRRLVGDRDPGNLAPASLKSEAYSASSTPRRAVSWPSCRKSS